jgi:hypothetical protein
LAVFAKSPRLASARGIGHRSTSAKRSIILWPNRCPMATDGTKIGEVRGFYLALCGVLCGFTASEIEPYLNHRDSDDVI